MGLSSKKTIIMVILDKGCFFINESLVNNHPHPIYKPLYIYLVILITSPQIPMKQRLTNNRANL